MATFHQALPVLFLFFFFYDELTDASILSANSPQRLPPLNDNGAPIAVNSSMYILDVREIDDDNRAYTIQCYFRQSWRDDRLKFKGEKLMLLANEEIDDIWKPDTFFVEANGGKLQTLTVPNIFVRITPDGTVLMSIRVTLNLRCKMNFKYYPHDEQTCGFSIESYGYTANDIKLKWKEDSKAVDIDNDIDLPEFQISGLSFGEDEQEFTFGKYSRLTVHLTLKRKLGDFMAKLFLPYILLVAIAWFALWIHPKFTTQRLVLSLVVLFIMIAVHMNMSNDITHTSYRKAIDVWVGFCIALVFASFLVIVYISTSNNEEEESESEDKTIIVSNLESGKPDQKVEISYVPIRRRIHACSLLKFPLKIDLLFRILYPVIFTFFNVCYWSYYAS